MEKITKEEYHLAIKKRNEYQDIIDKYTVQLKQEKKDKIGQLKLDAFELVLLKEEYFNNLYYSVQVEGNEINRIKGGYLGNVYSMEHVRNTHDKKGILLKLYNILKNKGMSVKKDDFFEKFMKYNFILLD